MSNAAEELMHPVLREIYQAWRDRGWDGAVPLWGDVRAANLQRWADNMVVIQVVDGHDYVYRHYGSHFKNSFGQDLTDRSIASLSRDVLPDEQRHLIEFEYRCARARKEPTWRSYTADFDGKLRTWQRLVLPASTDGRAVDAIVIAAFEMTEPEPAASRSGED